jgi:anti-sigma B factor antagonist
MDLSLATRALPGKRLLLQIRGRLDAAAAPAVRARIEELVEHGQAEIVCDLSQVESLDSSGLAALVSGRKAARERGGFLKLVGLNEGAAAVFRLTMLDRVFEIHPSVEAALA